jgi:hypothetical protein
MNITTSPIAIFCYKRKNNLIETINALSNATLADESILYIYSDGPKNETDGIIINDIREYLKQVKGFKEIKLIFSITNKGLAGSIIGGVSEILQMYDSVIVLEDDLLCTPNFLVYMNMALNTYASCDKVFSISGYSFNLKTTFKNSDDAYFLNRGWSWGWATWKNRWCDIDWEVKDYEEFSKNPRIQREFNKGGSDLTSMLKKQMDGRLDSWAIRWFYHQFKVGGITLYPKKSKILNIGFNAEATNTTGSSSRYEPKIDKSLKQQFVFPDAIAITNNYQHAFQVKMSVLSRIKSRLLSITKRYFNIFKTI